MTETSLIVLNEIALTLRRSLEKENEQMMKRMNQQNEMLLLIENSEKLLTENKRLRDEIESLKEQLVDERRQRAELEMKMAEMSKLSTGVATFELLSRHHSFLCYDIVESLEILHFF